jgi:hypothetical protein
MTADGATSPLAAVATKVRNPEIGMINLAGV